MRTRIPSIKYELLIGRDVSCGTHHVPKLSQALASTSVGVKGKFFAEGGREAWERGYFLPPSVINFSFDL